MRLSPSLPALVLAALLAAVAAGCGGGSESSSETTAAPGATTASAPLKVGLVTDIGGLNDRSFNHLANVGLQRAEKELGVSGRVLTSSANADYVPNLTSLARQRYDLIVGVGFLMADAVETVAKRFPDVDFAIIDYSLAAMKSDPQNVQGLIFREEQAGYLAGYLAGLVEKEGVGFVKPGAQRISAVGGQAVPAVQKYIAGYQAGAKKGDPQISAPFAYSQDFVDQAKCKELALNQIAQGSDVVFQVAGGCGLGAIDAARSANVWGIGVDADQSYLGKHILTSAVKKVDVSVYQTVQQVQDSSVEGGHDSVFELSNGGVGLGKISAEVPKSIRDRVDEARRQILSGAISDIPTTPR
jgi:basic membrane protein A